MSATAAMRSQVRRMVNEPTTATYDDDLLDTLIEAHPLLDERGEEAYTWDTSTSPPSQEDNEDWIPSYCLNAAASGIWEEKAAAVAEDFDFSADGGSFSRSKRFDQFMAMSRRYAARKAPDSIKAHMHPKESASSQPWIANLWENPDI